MEVSGQFHALAALPPGNIDRQQLYRRLAELQSRSVRGDEEKKVSFFPLPDSNPGRPACSTLNELSWLSLIMLLGLLNQGLDGRGT